jgi:hypothetical protein
VNGEPVDILDINGFMAVPIKEGENRIEFSYHTPGLREGCVMSAGALFVICVYLFLTRKKKSRIRTRINRIKKSSNSNKINNSSNKTRTKCRKKMLSSC